MRKLIVSLVMVVALTAMFFAPSPMQPVGKCQSGGEQMTPEECAAAHEACNTMASQLYDLCRLNGGGMIPCWDDYWAFKHQCYADVGC